jgi:hypothetical protein
MIRNYKPNKNPEIAGFDRSRVVDTNQKVWEYIRRYRSVDFVKEILKKEIKINQNLITIKSNQISSVITQCEQYYHLASTASSEIKPLLLYYGMVGLSKCLILSGDNNITLSSLDANSHTHSTHGLSVAPINEKDKRLE